MVAIYPTKTNKRNLRNKALTTGIFLTGIFSAILIILGFNFIEVFSKIILGAFGLAIYPICVSLVILGILLIAGKHIKCNKSLVIYSILWLVVFILILQLITSKNIDSSFGEYITTTFKSGNTAGGVLFGTILYPLYFLTYDIASYVILGIILVVLTALVIDRVYFEIKHKKVSFSANSSDKEIENNIELDEEPDIRSEFTKNDVINEKDDIFISDDEEIEDDDVEEIEESKLVARKKLGLDEEDDNSTEMLDKNYGNNNDNAISDKYVVDSNKPNIFVHEDEFTTITNKSNIKVQDTSKNEMEEKRKKDALDYLNITKGKFDTKKTNKGIDNVSPKSEVFQEDTKNDIKLDEQLKNNLERLKNLSNRTNDTNNSNNISNSTQVDIYDESLTAEKFSSNKEKIMDLAKQFNSINKMPKEAEKVYSGEVNEGLVDSNSPHIVQCHIEQISPNKSSAPKGYKKPPKYNKPPIDLLKKYAKNIDIDTDTINEKGQLIVDTLHSFKIETKIINAIKGPTFTRYELQMAPGISVNSVNNKINDLSMALESMCRVQVPIPGKNAFGIEVPNKKRDIVGIRDIIESPNFQNSKSPLTFALGKNISDECKVACVDKLVHTLVAGSTGSGKSVCLNALLISLLYKASPEDLRLILVDPKTVEFSLFNNLPHLLIPNTITECDKAISALSWLVDEMDRRYRKLASLGVKKISEYNETTEVISGQVPKMYYIVMIFDEVGDFMNRAKKEIEDKVILLAQKARACGIHLILATQRPTVDVITGTIKANLPSRIAFAVSSSVDSKTILEGSGAEYLLGMGDMLYLPQGCNEPDRIQGCFIDNNELKAVVQYVKDNNETDYDEEIEDQMFNKQDGFASTSNGVDDAFDPLLKDCLKFFIKSKKASASSLQGYFGIGYPKANKIVLQMEKAGFVSAGDNNGRRTLFITEQEYAERFGEEID